MQTPTGESRTNAIEPTPSMRVTKWIATVPVAAVCTGCARDFAVPTTQMHRKAHAEKALQMQFDRHECKRKS